MSRVFAILVILVLMAVVALVPRMGSKEPGDQERDLGKGYAYKADTLRRFRLLLDDPGWTLADPPRNPQGMLEAVHERTRLTFVLIPAGGFLMGSPEEEVGRRENEGPVHRVEVKPLLVCRAECSQRAWEIGGGANNSAVRSPDYPAEQVTWQDCHDWCKRNGLRLPSEAEWEYACRAGSQARFCFGDDESSLAEYACFRPNRQYSTHPVRAWKPNRWGLFGMHGNVLEWCKDTWHNDYAGAPNDGTAWTVGGNLVKVLRGGCFYSEATGCRSAFRVGLPPDSSSGGQGFRPTASLPE